jgi:hypothetical protein
VEIHLRALATAGAKTTASWVEPWVDLQPLQLYEQDGEDGERYGASRLDETIASLVPVHVWRFAQATSGS